MTGDVVDEDFGFVVFDPVDDRFGHVLPSDDGLTESALSAGDDRRRSVDINLFRSLLCWRSAPGSAHPYFLQYPAVAVGVGERGKRSVVIPLGMRTGHAMTVADLVEDSTGVMEHF